MNKNLIITAFLVAVACQSVSAALPKDNVSVSMMSKMYTNVTSFVKNHKIACATVASSALLVAAYKYVTREKVWTEGNCIKFKRLTLFGREYGSICLKTPQDAAAACQVFKKGNFSFSKMQEVAKCTHPSFEWSPTPMTDAEARKFQQDMQVKFQEFDRITENVRKHCSTRFRYQV